MKHGKKPTVSQCNFIKRFVENPKDWLICKNTGTEMVIQHRLTGDVKHLQKWDYTED